MTNAIADVLVVGAGPVGLSAAVVLRQLGHQVVIVDSQSAGANTSRAAAVHSRTLELLEPYGVTTSLVRRGVHASTFTVRDRDRVLMEVGFEALPTAYPYTLMISQADTEQFLLRRLTDLGTSVLRPATVRAVAQEADLVTATLSDGTQLRARYLIGADGMRSLVRDRAGIGFAGGSYAESFTLADVHISGGVPSEEVILYFSPAGLVVIAPLPDNRYRIVATVDEAPHEPDTAFVQRLLDDRGPRSERAVVSDVVWGSRFRVHHRIADSFRNGRILLAGDSAHVHSPAGGQGMNLGIEDAVTTGRVLARVFAGEPDSLLDEHVAARRRAARTVVSTTSRLTDLGTAPAATRPIRNTALGLVGKVPAVRRRVALRLSGLDRR
ncbi:FAD-dependent oxidoreductase [Nocardia sp. NPDC019395]|uniref:FAD-dependent oxidoreductase n=1 Tax=Nocardia sp. NPDC019395 TaxID=3154686 RepID=UPI0033E5B6C2